jgi:hypothetical protein
MVRRIFVIVLLVAAASFVAWFADRYLCDSMPEGARLCFGTSGEDF